MSWLIIYFAELFNSNYGLAIVIVTILARTVLIPLNVKQLKSSTARHDIQPEIKQLQEKYESKDDKTPKKIKKDQMASFEEQGVDAIAVCLQKLVHMQI